MEARGEGDWKQDDDLWISVFRFFCVPPMLAKCKFSISVMLLANRRQESTTKWSALCRARTN